MKIAFVLPPTAHFSSLMRALVLGVETAGDTPVVMRTSYARMDVPAGVEALCCWGWRKGSALRREHPHLPVLVMERGYVGDRYHWTSLGWNGLNGRATFPALSDASPDAYSRLYALLSAASLSPRNILPSWRLTAGYALILGQVPSDMAVRGVNLPYHYQQWAALLQRAGHKVKFRPHPKALSAPSGLPHRGYYTRGSLADDLAGAAFTVSWNSNSSVDSVLAGVPAVTLDKGSMAWAVSSHDLANPITMPSRTEWAAQLAWCQWNPAELSDGSAWRAVREAMPR